MGFTLDLDFVIEVANLFESLSQKTSDVSGRGHMRLCQHCTM